MITLNKKGAATGEVKKRLGYADWYKGEEADFSQITEFLLGGNTKEGFDEKYSSSFSRTLASQIVSLVKIVKENNLVIVEETEQGIDIRLA